MKLTAPKQRQGSHYERLAQAYLQSQGLKTLAQNWHYKNLGEIDLVMLDEGKAWHTLVFVEVRQRKSSGFGTALDSIGIAKQRRLIKTAQAFLQTHPHYADCEVRFDVVAFEGDDPSKCQPNWLAGAFVVS